MNASLLDLVAEVERLQAAAGALGCSPGPAATVQRWSADPATRMPAREPASRGDFCRQWVHSGGRLAVRACPRHEPSTARAFQANQSCNLAYAVTYTQICSACSHLHMPENYV